MANLFIYSLLPISQICAVAKCSIISTKKILINIDVNLIICQVDNNLQIGINSKIPIHLIQSKGFQHKIEMTNEIEDFY
jgi:hypothetical protein